MPGHNPDPASPIPVSPSKPRVRTRHNHSIAEQQVDVVRQQRPSIDGDAGHPGQVPHFEHKSLPILIIIKNLLFFYSPNNYMVQRP
jgi:hypothetical protein